VYAIDDCFNAGNSAKVCLDTYKNLAHFAQNSNVPPCSHALICLVPHQVMGIHKLQWKGKVFSKGAGRFIDYFV